MIEYNFREVNAKMEERRIENFPYLEMLEKIKSLPLTYEYEYQPDGKIFAVVKEFPLAYAYESNYEEMRRGLVKSMREWAGALDGEFDSWKTGREHEIPYLLKIYVSTNEELYECLKSAKSDEN